MNIFALLITSLLFTSSLHCMKKDKMQPASNKTIPTYPINPSSSNEFFKDNDNDYVDDIKLFKVNPKDSNDHDDLFNIIDPALDSFLEND